MRGRIELAKSMLFPSKAGVIKGTVLPGVGLHGSIEADMAAAAQAGEPIPVDRMSDPFVEVVDPQWLAWCSRNAKRVPSKRRERRVKESPKRARLDLSRVSGLSAIMPSEGSASACLVSAHCQIHCFFWLVR